MTILFVPGFMADVDLWADLTPHLDTSESLEFAELTGGESIRGLAQAILSKAPARFALVGFSMGGYVSREMARLAPERVRSLALIATSARGDTPEQVRRKASSVRQLQAATFRGLSGTSIKASVHPDRVNDNALLERIRAMGIRLGKDVFVSQAGMPRDGDLEHLSAISCPTLVVVADSDQLRSLEEAEELAAGIQGAAVVVVPNSGHMIPMEEPAALGRILSEWLRTTAQ
jgi:pimeloyl-ACP methyl ester carboxylesterase